MLPRAHRVVRADDFRLAVRRGRRTSTPHAVIYRVADQGPGPRFGVVVSKKVGGAVVRNRVRRRIQAVCATVIAGMSPDSLIVIRALPGCDSVSWDTLRSEIGNGLRGAVSAS